MRISFLTLVIAAGLATAADARSLKDNAVAPASTWSGFYFGGNLGGAWSNVDYDHVETFGAGSREAFSTDPGGFVGGIQAGYQQQFGSWLAGVEVGWTALNDDDSAFTNLNAFPRNRVTELGDMWSVAGRLGYVVGPWMTYAKAGYANVELGFKNKNAATGVVLGSSNEHEGAWLLGTGFEYAFTRNVSLGLDYTFVTFEADHQMRANGAPVAARNEDIEADIHLLTARLNFRFN